MKTILFLLLLAGLPLGAATYYVDSEAGDDARAGTGEATAWRSLARANAADLNPGDRMLFRRGGAWRGTLRLKSGTPGARTYYGAYGKGPKPVFQGSVARDRPEDWLELEPGLWATRTDAYRETGVLLGPEALSKWSASFQAGVKGTLATLTENGTNFTRVTCTAAPAGRRSNHLQLWGASLTGLAAPLVLRFRMRGGFRPAQVAVTQPHPPWARRAAASVRLCGAPDAKGWQAAEVLLLPDEPTFAEGTVHMSLGDLVQAGESLDLRFERLSRVALNPRAHLGADVGILVLDGGTTWGVKKWSRDDLRSDLDYWYDPEGDRVVVKLDRNPARAYRSVELALTKVVIPHAAVHDVTVEAFTVRDSGGFAFGGSGAARVTVRNCDIAFIGGGLQYWRKDEQGRKVRPVRYGNGIEYWSPARDCLVERCRFWQIYDAAVTPQQSGSTNGFDNIVFRDNVFWQCEYSFEFWNHTPESHTFGVVFEHNTSVDAGGGWGHAQRPDPNGAHLMSYVHVGAMRNQVVRNNVFCRSSDRGFRFFTDWRAALAMDHNLDYEPLNVLSQLNANPRQARPWKFGAGPGEFARYQSATGLDAGSVYAEPQFVNPSLRDYRLRPGTPGTDLATDGGPVGARNMPGIDQDQSVPPWFNAQ